MDDDVFAVRAVSPRANKTAERELHCPGTAYIQGENKRADRIRGCEAGVVERLPTVQLLRRRTRNPKVPEAAPLN